MEETARQAEDIKTCPGKQETRTFFGFSITIVFTRLSPDFSKISLNETLASKQSKKQQQQQKLTQSCKALSRCYFSLLLYKPNFKTYFVK